MTAVEDFTAGIRYLEDATNLGYWFVLKLHELRSVLVPDDGTDKTTYQTRISSSTLLTADEKTEALALVDEVEVYDVRSGRDVVPAYYSNTREIIRQISLLIAGYYVDTPTHPNIENIYNLYVDSDVYLMSDEDEYKIEAYYVENLQAAEVELLAAIDTVNAAE